MKKIIITLLNIIFIIAFAKADKVDSLMLLIDSNIVSEKQIEYKLTLAKEFADTDVNKAIIYAKNARLKAIKLNCPLCIAESNFAVGKYYNDIGVHHEALVYLNDALSTFEQLNYNYKKIKTVKLIGNIYYYSKEYEMALKYFLELVEFAQSINDTSLIIDGLISRGRVYGNVSMLDSALILFKQANSLCQEVNEPTFEVQSLFYIGDVYRFSEQPKKALEVFHKIEKDYKIEENDIKVLANMYNSMTHAYIQLGDITNAKYYNEKSKENLPNISLLWSISDYYEFSFIIDTLERDYRSAVNNLMKYKEFNDSINNSSFKEQLANFESLYSLQKKENQIDKLVVSNELKDSEIARKKIINYSFSVLTLLFLILIFQVYRSRKKVREKNHQLEDMVEELRTTQQSLVQSEKMASLGTLTAGVAHELNNPLNFISGGVFLLNEIKEDIERENSKEINEKLKMVLHVLSEGVNRSTSIVKSLKTFSFKGTPKLVESDIHEIIDSTLLFLKSKMDEKIEIKKNYKLTKQISLYPEKMHQILMNIIDNAVFSLNSYETKEKLINIITKEVGENAEIIISNNGLPIDENSISKLFDPFFTTKEPGMGTGLGLSICYSLIKEHNGDIYAKNTPNGVSFIVSIPL